MPHIPHPLEQFEFILVTRTFIDMEEPHVMATVDFNSGFENFDHGQGNVDGRARISTPVKQCSENKTGSLVNILPSDGAIRNGTRLRAITAPGVAPEPKSKLNKFTNVFVDLRNNATTDESAVKAAALSIRGYVPPEELMLFTKAVFILMIGMSSLEPLHTHQTLDRSKRTLDCKGKKMQEPTRSG